MNDGMNGCVWRNITQQRIAAALIVSIAGAGYAAAAIAGTGESLVRGNDPEPARKIAFDHRVTVSADAIGALAHRPIGAHVSISGGGGALLGPFCTMVDCDGQPADSGGDSCDDAVPFVMDVGDVQLVCGDNTPAGGQDEECGALAPDPVWWEAFTIDQCADVLIDYCCTSLVPPTFYIVLSKGCPNCNLVFPESGDECVTDDDCIDRPHSRCNANGAGVYACRDFGFGDRGPRECADGNPSVIYRGLGPGTYYRPIYTCTDPVGCNPIATRGEYQIHIEVLPSSNEPGGCCVPDIAPSLFIEGAQSLRTHGGGIELAIDLEATDGIEPRQGGPKKLAFDISADMDAATVNAGNVQVFCAAGPAPSVLAASLSGADVVVVEIDATANLDCCQFTFAGMLSVDGDPLIGPYDVRSIQGDINFSGAVTGADPSLVKPHFGEIAGVDLAGPQFDYNVSGGVTGGDFSLIKPLLGDVGGSCPASPAGADVECVEVTCEAECEALNGGYLGDGIPCDGELCNAGACCLDNGRRCQVLGPNACLAAGGDFAGPGQDCDPDCTCEPPNGTDTCAELGDAVLIPSDGTVITFAGDTTFAHDIDCALLDPDLTWWEKIDLEDCVNLTVDACCTDPLLNVIYQVLYSDCPCDGLTVGSAQFGAICEDGNADVRFLDVAPGTYYYPVHACIDAENCGLAISRLGPYQLHMRAEPSPVNPCCLPDTDACQLICANYCRQLGGFPLVQQFDCDEPNPCESGSCCLGGHNECQETDLDTCLGLGGRYSGGATCDDGPCIVNDSCEDAVLIECDSINDAHNEFATTTADEPGYGCHGAGQGTFGVGNVWFKFVAENESARVDTCESVPPADDSLVSMFEVGDPQNPCDSLTEIGCSDDVAGCILATNFGSDMEVNGLTVGETYYIQLGSWTEPDRGNYQLRIKCPAVIGACCYQLDGEFVCVEGLDRPECDALGGRYGGENSVCGPPGDLNEIDPPCGTGACCRSDDLVFCALLDQDACEALCPECGWQGDGIDCVDPMNPCAGSCCTGDGDACVETTELGCLNDPPGGLGGVVWTRYLACNNPGIDCDGADPEICTQPETNCHLSDQQGHGDNDKLFVTSDRNLLSATKVADSFVPTATPITSECWWGAYANFGIPQNPNCIRIDNFRIVYYAADGPSGLPGTVIRTSNIGATRSLTGNVFLNVAGNVIPEWEYRGNVHPNADVAIGACAWFEVTNDTGFQNCRWFWATSGDGDGLAVNDPNHINGYEVGEELSFDMAWCANVAIEANDCD